MAMFFTYDPVIGFYNDKYNKVPKNALPIDDEHYNSLFAGLASGYEMYWDANTKALALKEIPEPPPIPVNRKLSSLEFLNLFTVAEKDVLMQYARNNNQAMLWLITATGASYVDLSDPLTTEGLEYLLSLGVITNERFNEIKNTGL